MSEAPSNIFGTDGVRDIAGAGWLASAAVRRLGAAIARFAHARSTQAAGAQGVESSGPRFLIGRDTRTSGALIEAQLAGALAKAGCRVESAGVVPTPAVSLLVVEERFDFGAVISASHNPPEFNGVKLFDGRGRKLAARDEEEITRVYHSISAFDAEQSAPVVRPLLRERYRASLLLNALGKHALPGMRILLDCAHGATASLAPAVFGGTGAMVMTLHATEDGRRINVGCGSTDTDELARAVVANRAQLGIAFDGDGDRAIFIDEQGERADGDEIIAILARHRQERGRLAKHGVVVTVMSNAGMESYLRAHGVTVERVGVGDREVAQLLEERGYSLGGEQSGHIIFADEAATGDGIRTGLHVARVLHELGRPLSELRREIPRFPQTLLAVRVRAKPPLEQLSTYRASQVAAERALAGRGRVLVRYSGTEPLARVLVEGPDADENRRLAASMADAIRAELGA